MKRDLKAKSTYQCLFHPESIAVIGAGNNILKPGGRVFYNIRENGYNGNLWAINPKTPDIQGMPTFKTIEDLPGPPDLAIIAIPAGAVIPAMQSLANKGTGAVIVLTSGFGEKNDQGKALEQEMLAIGKSAGMDIIGPNCSGFMTRSYKGKFAGILPTRPGSAVDIISGSGATVDYIMEMADGRGLSFGTAVNLGNSIQYGVEDLIGMYDEHYGPEDGKILLVYLESVRKPAILLHHARSLVKKGCTVIAVKSGNTPAGHRAAASHTGAMADSDTAVQALMDKAGIIR
ncbi:MAG: CoA-binding protein, partial [Desulfobacula sp.]